MTSWKVRTLNEMMMIKRDNNELIHMMRMTMICMMVTMMIKITVIWTRKAMMRMRMKTVIRMMEIKVMILIIMRFGTMN